jgi:3-hydroxyisobutyrate dehydrogenase
MTEMVIGFCGVGRMGTAMASRLIDQGRNLVVWDRNTVRSKDLIALGAQWPKTAAEEAAQSSMILTSLPDAQALYNVFNGPTGLLSASPIGRLFVEMSTVTPTTIRVLDADVRAKGASLLDCPIGGTVGPAREGRLVGMGGGDLADFQKAEPILRQLCRRVDHLGTVGSGSAMKLAVNLPLSIYWEVLGEALVLCRDAGIETEKMLEVLAESSGGPNALRSRITPFAAKSTTRRSSMLHSTSMACGRICARC